MSVTFGSLDQLCKWLEIRPEAIVLTRDKAIRQAILAQTGHQQDQVKIAIDFPAGGSIVSVGWFHEVLRGQPADVHQPPSVFIVRSQGVSLEETWKSQNET